MRGLVLLGLALAVAGGALYFLVRSQDQQQVATARRDAGVVDRPTPKLVDVDAAVVDVPPWTIRGRVTERGKAQPAIAVTMQEYLGDDTTDADGDYELSGTRAGFVTVIAEDRRTGRRGKRIVKVATGAEVASVDIELEPTGRLDIRVVDLDGKPVHGAEVAVWGPAAVASFYPSTTATTDRNGTISRLGLTAGRVMVVVRIARESVVQAAELATPFAQQTMEFVISRHGGSKIAGFVRDDRGQALVGARVRIGGYGGATALTDKSGHFVFDRLLEGKYELSAWTREDDDKRPRHEIGSYAATDTTDVTITVPRLGRLTGLVHGFGLPPIISIMPVSSPLSIATSTETTGNAIVSVELPHGRYRVVAFNLTEVGSTEATIRPGEQTQIAIDASRSATLYGLATVFSPRPSKSPSGSPAPDRSPAIGYTCSAGPRSTKTDGRGAFTLEAVPPGELRVTCESNRDGFGSTQLFAKPGGNDVRVEVVVGSQRLASLGADIETQRDQLVFANVKPDGAAAKAGVADGDILISVEGFSMTGPSTTAGVLYLMTRPPGQATSIKIRPRTGSAFIDLTITAK